VTYEQTDVPATLEDTRPRENWRRARVPRWVYTAASLVVVLVAWQAVGSHINPILGSYPTAIFKAFIALVQSGQLGPAALQSGQALAMGYVLAVIVGIPLGLLIGRSSILEATVGIYIIAGYAMPLVALIPLLVLWFGLGMTVKVAIIFLMAVFPVCINTWVGVNAVPRSLIEVGKSFMASDATIMRRIVFPAALPYIVAGVRLAIGKAVVAMVIAEFFTAISGLGAIIINSANSFDTATMLVPIIILMAGATLLDAGIARLERRLAPWQQEVGGKTSD
jgi:ABC-type nitrate/sulfonate/bicarbonate transport system permease component